MKSTIWAFGDSFTDSYKPPENGHRHWRHDYIDWKGYAPKNYVEILAEELGLPLINKAGGGTDNNFIFEEFCKVCDYINPDDIVIFGWTTLERLRLVRKDNRWGYFNPGLIFNDDWFADMEVELEDFDFVSKETIRELMFNKKNNLNSLELMNWVKLINLSLKNMRVFHWCWDSNLQIHNIYRTPNYKTIKMETNGELQDNHWCEEGHRLFADWLIKKFSEGNEPASENKKFI
jgi:hypothetical protein